MSCREEDIATADRLWLQYARTGDPRTRDEIVEQFRRLAYSIANRFSRNSGHHEDVVQVALVGLVKAVDRFDPSTNHRFSTFATPTIMGEIRRYFRDHSWNVHVPRGMQELAQRVNRTARSLTERTGMSPTVQEIAAEVGESEDRVLEAMALEEINRPLSLDGVMEGSDTDRPAILEHCLGEDDRGLADTEHRVCVDQMLDLLPESLREVLELRYLDQLSQRETGRRLGLSQMQVSRMERRALDTLRGELVLN